jgi:hypothetical protein
MLPPSWIAVGPSQTSRLTLDAVTELCEHDRLSDRRTLVLPATCLMSSTAMVCRGFCLALDLLELYLEATETVVYLTSCLYEAEDVINEEENILLQFLAEVLCDRQCTQPYAHPSTRWFTHLAVD